MSQERLKVLQMLRDGQIDAGQAAEMLNALKSQSQQPAAESQPETPAKEDVPAMATQIEVEEDETYSADKQDQDVLRKRLRIQINDGEGSSRVNISIPMGLIKFGMSIGERFAPTASGVNWDDLNIDIEDGADKVRIFVE